ncbi:hypothetical protein TWF281_004183 [Arthrobotrys megalospora]
MLHTPGTITSLPLELQSRILSFLPFLVQGTATQVCMLWRSLLNSRQLQKVRYRVIPGSRHLQTKQPLEVHRFFYSDLQCDSACVICDEDEKVENRAREKFYDRPPSDPESDSSTAASDSFLAMQIRRKSLEVKYYEFWVRKWPPPEVNWSPAFDERFHKPRLQTSHPFLDDLVFLPAAEESEKTKRKQEAGSSRVLRPRAPVKGENVTVPVHYRVQWYDRHADLEPAAADQVIHIYPTTTVGQLVSQAWKVLRKACFFSPDIDADGIEKVEYIKFQIFKPSSSGKPKSGKAKEDVPFGLKVELYSERDDESDSESDSGGTSSDSDSTS